MNIEIMFYDEIGVKKKRYVDNTEHSFLTKLSQHVVTICNNKID